MPKNSFRGDATPAAKALRFVKPADIADVQPIFTVNNKRIEWLTWDAATMVADINAAAFPELATVTASASGDDVVLTGVDNDDWNAAIAITPNVLITLTQGAAAVNQISTISFDGATAGTYTLTLAGETTAAIAVDDVGAARTAIDALASWASSDYTLTDLGGSKYKIEFEGTYAATAVVISIDGALLTKPIGAIVIARTHDALAARHEVICVGLQASDVERVDYLGNFVNISSDLTAAEIKALLQPLAPAADINVYGGQIAPGAVAEATFWVIEFIDRPGGPDIFNVASPNDFFADYGNAKMAQLVSSSVGLVDTPTYTGTRELLIFDTIAGSITVEYDGRELEISQGITDTSLQSLLTSHAEYAEWHVWDTPDWPVAPSSGTEHTHLMFATRVRDGAVDIPDDVITQTGGDGTLAILNHGGAGASGAKFEISRSGPINGGTFDIDLSEGTVASLAWDITAASFETAAALIRTSVTVPSGSGTPTDPWLFYNGTNADSDQTPTSDPSSLVGTLTASTALVTSAAAAVSAIQTVLVSPRSASGAYTMRYGTEGPISFAYNLNAATFKTQLEDFPALSTAGDTAVAYDSESGLFTITFQGALAGSVVELLAVTESTLATATDESNAVLDSRPSGASDFSSVDNWTLGRMPEFGDDVWIDDTPSPIEYGLRQYAEFTVDTATEYVSAAADFRNGQIVRVFTDGTIPAGLALATDYYVIAMDETRDRFQLAATKDGPPINITSTGSGTHHIGVQALSFTTSTTALENVGRREQAGTFREYRPRYVEMGVTSKADFGQGVVGSGTALTRLNIRDTAPTISVLLTTSSDEDGFPSVNILCNGAATFIVYEGLGGIAAGDDETSTLADIEVRGGEGVFGTVTATSDFCHFGGTWSSRELTVDGIVKSYG